MKCVIGFVSCCLRRHLQPKLWVRWVRLGWSWADLEDHFGGTRYSQSWWKLHARARPMVAWWLGGVRDKVWPIPTTESHKYIPPHFPLTILLYTSIFADYGMIGWLCLCQPKFPNSHFHYNFQSWMHMALRHNIHKLANGILILLARLQQRFESLRSNHKFMCYIGIS